MMFDKDVPIPSPRQADSLYHWDRYAVGDSKFYPCSTFADARKAALSIARQAYVYALVNTHGLWCFSCRRRLEDNIYGVRVWRLPDRPYRMQEQQTKGLTLKYEWENMEVGEKLSIPAEVIPQHRLRARVAYVQRMSTKKFSVRSVRVSASPNPAAVLRRIQ